MSALGAERGTELMSGLPCITSTPLPRETSDQDTSDTRDSRGLTHLANQLISSVMRFNKHGFKGNSTQKKTLFKPVCFLSSMEHEMRGFEVHAALFNTMEIQSDDRLSKSKKTAKLP